MTDKIVKVQNPKTKLWSIINQTSGQILATGVDLDKAIDETISYIIDIKKVYNEECDEECDHCAACPCYMRWIEQILGLRD